jgi:dolichol kinase
MFIRFFIGLTAIFALLCVTELLWRRGKLRVEASRKVIHIGTGVIIAFLPYFLSWTAIQLLSLALLIVIVISYKLNIFRSIHSVKRITKGEILYPIGIGLCALLEPAPWVFAIAILHLALADGIAALIGVHYGKRTAYTIISHGKSLAGSAAFFIVSFCIFAGASVLVADDKLPAYYVSFAGAALILTVVENVSWYGLDDITVPVSVIVILTLF